MTTTRMYLSGSPTLSWLRNHPGVIEAARQQIDVPGTARPDAVLADPALLVTAVRTVLVRAIDEDAPPGVAEDLLISYRTMRGRIQRLESRPFVRERMADLRGLRDGVELVPRLRQVIAEAPDAESRATIDRLIRIADVLPASDEMVVTDLPDGSVVITTGPSGLVDTGGPGPVGSGPVDSGPVDSGTVNPGSPDGTTDTGTLLPPLEGLPAGAEDFAINVGIDVATSLGIQNPTAAGDAAARKAFEQFVASHSVSGSGNGASGGGFFSALGTIIGGAVGFILGGPGGAALGAGIGARARAPWSTTR